MRYDQTNWLIHFVSNRNGEQSDCVTDESHYNYYTNDKLEPDASAFAILKRIIQLGGLIPGYSFRNGRTTIYGGKPAICVTEMPIYSFAKYVQQRNNEEKVSAYGIAFLKKEFFSAGGRPVIYGLSTNSYSFEINQSATRILKESVLPKNEQYRYVAYNLSENKWVDWSHEREWRWVARQDNSIDICYSSGQIKGLSLFSGRENGGFFSKVCIIVWDEKEAKEIQKILTGFYLYGSNNYDTLFSKELIKDSIIIILGDLVSSVENELDLKSQTIEGIQEKNLYQTILTSYVIDKSTRVKVDKAINSIADISEEASTHFIKNNSAPNKELFGFANVASHDITSPIIQHLLKARLASGPYDGKIYLNLKTKRCSYSSTIRYEEYVCEAVSNYLSKELNIHFYVDSWLD